MSDHPIRLVARAAGWSIYRLSKELGLSNQRLHHWMKPGIDVPAKYVPRLVDIADGAVRHEELNRSVDWESVRRRGDRFSSPVNS